MKSDQFSQPVSPTELPLRLEERVGVREREKIATGLVPVVPALLRYSNSTENTVAQKRGNHPDKRGGGILSQALRDK